MKARSPEELRILARVWKTLPKRKQCPGCERIRGKASFGMRTLERKAGLPTKVIIQSHCRICRKQAAKVAAAKLRAQRQERRAAEVLAKAIKVKARSKSKAKAA